MNLILDIDGITQGERARLTKKTLTTCYESL